MMLENSYKGKSKKPNSSSNKLLLMECNDRSIEDIMSSHEQCNGRTSKRGISQGQARIHHEESFRI